MITGPRSGEWRFRNTVDDASLDYSRCGEAPDLALEARIRAVPGTSDPSRTSSVSMDFPEGGTTYRFAWKRCPA